MKKEDFTTNSDTHWKDKPYKQCFTHKFDNLKKPISWKT